MIKQFSLIIVLISMFSCNSNKKETKLPILKATSHLVDIKDGENLKKETWYLTPQAKPDIYNTDVTSSKKVTFYTDIDSISFTVEPKKKYDFIILLNEKDTCWTQIQTIPHFDFDAEYIQKNKETYSFEIPEVQELVHLIFALTPTGIDDKNMVNHRTEYYKEIIENFSKYKNEPIVLKLDSWLKEGYYSTLKMDACGFYFDGNKIEKDSTYERLSWNGANKIEPFISEIENFSNKIGFRKFYKKHKEYYTDLIAKSEKQMPIKKQWDWLESKFDFKYDNYRITFSPLVNGSHSTNHFKQNNFKQSVMFIAGPIESTKYSEENIKALMTRSVFTEIDHNYVNPISDIYLNEINNSMNNLSKWTTENALSNYKNSYLVFNEYMTWSVFALYALENYDSKNYEFIKNKIELQMTERRGFIKFKEFNTKVLELYEEKLANEKIKDLYPKILSWCKEQ
ncbi:DUF4932 domain-containing protein [Polaribacter vadi]|uniref:DUF4932 domain-containing protein n=1 Tax=Polaribacter TaxID=52959 RepID=UPI001C095FAC|nr:MULTISPECIES: DUF4932 domain-containing protein [Polaribacter]MBU3013081.1 DUF4932 domain-containing protein [Polaribacter vadi]MDO6742900.1 DUF4932 domain-containing protein [Polaribacter sp. 1_MG-2023]